MRRLLWIALVALAPGFAGCRDRIDVHPTPAAPQGLYSVTGDRRVSLYWLPNTEADLDHYNVYSSVQGATGPFQFVVSTREPSYLDTGVQNGSTYWYAVTAVSTWGVESAPSEANIHDTPRPEHFGWRMWNSYAEDSLGGKYDQDNALNLANADSLSRKSGHADLYYEAATGHHWLVSGNDHTGLQDGGVTPDGLEQYDYAPNSGWLFGSYLEMVPQHTYVVWTADNHYAKVYVRSVGGDFAVVDWAYQTDPGNRELKARVPVAHLGGLGPVGR